MQLLHTPRLRLEPLTGAHADALFAYAGVLTDEAEYRLLSTPENMRP